MLTFLIGGARSGKSSLALSLAGEHPGPVTFVATAPNIPGDDDLALRVERHRSERPTGWATVEEDRDLASALSATVDGLVVIDCLTVWLGNLLHHGADVDGVMSACDEAIAAATDRAGDAIVVSNEVGSGIVPADAATRTYRDLLGRVNQRWAAVADRALLVVAGLTVPLARHDRPVP